MCSDIHVVFPVYLFMLHASQTHITTILTAQQRHQKHYRCMLAGKCYTMRPSGVCVRELHVLYIPCVAEHLPGRKRMLNGASFSYAGLISMACDSYQ